MDKRLEVRCFCHRSPLLAMCGRDAKTGKPYVHIKSVRGDRINVEAVFTDGIVRICCRVCKRWHAIKIVEYNLDVSQEELPATIPV